MRLSSYFVNRYALAINQKWNKTDPSFVLDGTFCKIIQNIAMKAYHQQSFSYHNIKDWLQKRQISKFIKKKQLSLTSNNHQDLGDEVSIYNYLQVVKLYQCFMPFLHQQTTAPTIVLQLYSVKNVSLCKGLGTQLLQIYNRYNICIQVNEKVIPNRFMTCPTCK